MGEYYFGGAYETNLDGTIRKYYSFGGARMMRTIDTSHPAPGTLTYFLTDHLGSTLAVLSTPPKIGGA